MKFSRSKINSQVIKLNEETIHYLHQCYKYISFEQFFGGFVLQGSGLSLEAEAVRCPPMASTRKRQFLDANAQPAMFQNPVFRLFMFSFSISREYVDEYPALKTRDVFYANLIKLTARIQLKRH